MPQKCGGAGIRRRSKRDEGGGNESRGELTVDEDEGHKGQPPIHDGAGDPGLWGKDHHGPEGQSKVVINLKYGFHAQFGSGELQAALPGQRQGGCKSRGRGSRQCPCRAENWHPRSKAAPLACGQGRGKAVRGGKCSCRGDEC